ncbi:RbsD/FucU domain-containing protein [Streptomyces smyrnaeus]|uniref:RbsD/FucU domain-containing protein n=1 Tax=Streptomyces smyrnaeus TaxID=1387713 RepID=UPI000C4F0646|nr:RbsD/FucU domain-containing protein [Streptomyces smyrnaeus]
MAERAGHMREVLTDYRLGSREVPYGRAAPTVADLAVSLRVPRFTTVVNAVLAELKVEGATAAREVHGQNPKVAAFLGRRFHGLTSIPHDELKARTRGVRLVVRAGEATPYANIILRCGVPF